MQKILFLILSWIALSAAPVAKDLKTIVTEKKPLYILCVHGSALKTNVAMLRTTDGKAIEVSYKNSKTNHFTLPGPSTGLPFEQAIAQVIADFIENAEIQRETETTSVRDVLDKTVIYAGYAGAGTPDRQELVADAIRDKYPALDILVTSDIALLKNCADQGVFLIVDAGSIVYRKLAGEEVRAGGHSAILGSDEGSAVVIGLKAFLAAVDIEGGVFHDTNSRKKFKEDSTKEFFDAIRKAIPSEKQKILDVRYEIIQDLKQGNTKKVVDLLPIVLKLAYENKNSVALYILHEAAKGLADRLFDITVGEKLEKNFPLYIYGNVFQSEHWEKYLEAVLGLRLSRRFEIHNVASKNIALEATLHQLKD